MTEQELREMALKLAKQHAEWSSRYEFDFGDDGIVALVRAAVAHGLRMSEEVVGKYVFVGQAVAAIRAKADELESAQ